MRKFNTLIGAILVKLGDADGMICGMIGQYHMHLKCIEQVLGRASDAEHFATMNLLSMPNVEAANIAYNLPKMIGGEGVTVGPFLFGAAKPMHTLTAAATVRRIINMTAVISASLLRARYDRRARVAQL